MSTKDRSDVLQGTLDMLVLRALQLEPMHGWGITERIGQWSEQVLQLGQGSLYPALYRLERQGYIRSEWRVTDNNRRARYYSMTATGRRYLNDSLAQWRRMSRAINLGSRHHDGGLRARWVRSPRCCAGSGRCSAGGSSKIAWPRKSASTSNSRSRSTGAPA